MVNFVFITGKSIFFAMMEFFGEENEEKLRTDVLNFFNIVQKNFEE